MTEIKPIQNEFVTVKEYLGVINHGDGYAIVNVYTRECIARNITSFTDCLNAIKVLLEAGGGGFDQSLETILDDLDLATVRSIATYFEQYAPDIILRYHRDHNATYEEAQILCQKCREIANQLRQVRTEENLRESIQQIELLKQKVSRFQHREHKYRWTTHLDRDVLAKLNPILSGGKGGSQNEGDIISNLNLKPEIERLVRKYAPETVKVKKDSNILGYSWYKCYGQNGNRLGTIRGSSGDRYWQYGGLDSTKHR